MFALATLFLVLAAATYGGSPALPITFVILAGYSLTRS